MPRSSFSRYSSEFFRSPRVKLKVFIGVVVLALFLIGGAAAMFLAQTSQDVRNQASGNDPYTLGSKCPTEGEKECKADWSGVICRNGVWQPLPAPVCRPSDTKPGDVPPPTAPAPSSCVEGTTMCEDVSDGTISFLLVCKNGVWGYQTKNSKSTSWIMCSDPGVSEPQVGKGCGPSSYYYCYVPKKNLYWCNNKLIRTWERAGKC